jgi:hypothetical protein
MSEAITVSLHSPLRIATDPVREIVLRPPGPRVFEAMAAARNGRGFSEADMLRFAARLSGHTIATLRRLAPDDLYHLGRAIERLYRGAARRFRTARPVPEGAA